ncbi:uncharacterized protein LOC114308456 [Camellia sinensis]|uniref:uncharacterized protein LOC114308456 n=1 Tax=Camellia sinensis TaxID=4442 RepID=UPI001036362B|nr:uncharacterized protein LOC114308456 [Camellia sinensis]
MVHCKPCSTPIAHKSSAVPSSIDVLPYAQPSFYRSIVGALQYLTITRPDIAFAINQAYNGSYDLHAFTDSNWVGDCTDRRSTSSFCNYLGSNLIYWFAKKQHTVSRSSTETEYRSMVDTTAEICWIQQLLKDLSVPSFSVPVLWCDNVSAMALAFNPLFHSKTM